MATPLFRAAGLVPSSVSIHLVNSKELNAFVANGQQLFIHTGLLIRAESASQVIGVIAHETGHISGGHLSRLGKAQEQAIATSVLTTIIGAVSAVGAGRSDVGSAVVLGGQHAATRNYLSFSRTQESSADQAALTFLDNTGHSAKGLLEFMEILEGQELLISANQDAYARTHPLSQDRIDAIRAHLQRSKFSGAEVDPAVELAFQRTQAKLIGYFNPPKLTLRTYPESDRSIPARYARAFAYSRLPDHDKAIDILDGLLHDVPDDPYFLELKAQVALESGRVDLAIDTFRKSVTAAPEEPLLRGEFGHALIAAGGEENLREAIEQIRFSLSRERRSPSNWRNLGIAYGKLGDMGHSSLALAEEALLVGKESEARFHAGRASESFPRGSPEWLQAEDILLALKNRKN